MEAQFKRYRQVAIVVSSLHRDTADHVLAQMSDEEASSVRRAILSLDEITDDEQAEALTAFMQRSGKHTETTSQTSPRQRGALDSGVELDAGLAAKFQDDSSQKPLPAFECLQGVDGAWLAPRISHEHPQTIAVVVSQLSQAEAARLLGALSPTQQTEIIRRLADLDEMDIESLREVETYLTGWLAENLRDRKRRTAGVSNVAAILRAADPQTRNRLVKQLRLSDEQLAEQLKQSQGQAVATMQHSGQSIAAAHAVPAERVDASLPVTANVAGFSVAQAFEDLANWTERSLRSLLRECEPDVILLALTGASEQVVRRVLEMFPARQAATLKHALNHPGPTRLSDVTGAQEEIVQLALRMEQEGRLPPRTGRLSMAA